MKPRHVIFNQQFLCCLFIFLCIILHNNYASCEWFSSLGQMEDLVQDEMDLITSLRDYISAEEMKLYRIKR